MRRRENSYVANDNRDSYYWQQTTKYAQSVAVYHIEYVTKRSPRVPVQGDVSYTMMISHAVLYATRKDEEGARHAKA